MGNPWLGEVGEARVRRLVATWATAGAIFIGTISPSSALEGATAAGPIGGTDIRSAILPPPGLYGGVAGVVTGVHEIHNGSGQPAPGLNKVNILATVGGPLLVYVPNFKVLDGAVGLVGAFPLGEVCGQLTAAVPSRCISGFGDPYVEAIWSRSFGHLRRSHDPGALPILEGLSVALGLGTVIPVGHYDAQDQHRNGATIGNNTLDVAPTFAVTYTTPPLLFDGTEFSTKVFWNHYGTNSQTQYQAGQMVSADFALTEHIGRFQVGAIGVYAMQMQDDRQFGAVVPPDGHRLELLNLGGIVACDLADIGAVIRVKALATVFARNAVAGRGVVVSFAKKLY